MMQESAGEGGGQSLPALPIMQESVG